MGWLGRLDRIAARVLGPPVILAIRLYQVLVSNRLPRVCVYTPSCSRYAILALRRYGLVEATRMTRARLRACDGGLFRGFDPPGHGPPGQPLPPPRAEVHDV